MTEAAVAGRFLLATCTIACILFGLRFALRGALRIAPPSRSRTLVLVETLRLPDAAALHLVRIGDRLVVVGRAGTHIAAICAGPGSAPAADGDP